MFGTPETTSGGRALKFFSSVRLDIRRLTQIKDPTGKAIGNRTRIKVVKNKMAPPYTECEFDIMFNEGISRTGSILDLGIEFKVLDKKGSYIVYEGKMLGQGREAAKEYLRQNPGTSRDALQGDHGQGSGHRRHHAGCGVRRASSICRVDFCQQYLISKF